MFGLGKPKVIIYEQKKLLSNLSLSLKQQDNYGITKNAYILDLLAKMLQIDPEKRISLEELD